MRLREGQTTYQVVAIEEEVDEGGADNAPGGND